MRRIEYKVTLDGEPFSVASCYMERPYSDEDNHPLPIEMNVIRCAGVSGNINIVHAVCLDDNVDADFARQYIDALMGQSEDWKLVHFQVSAGHIKLRYYRSATDNVGEITLCVDGNPLNLLYLTFKVPHQDGRPAAEYRVDFNYHRLGKGDPFRNDVSVMERLPFVYRRTLFLLSSEHPDEMSIVENVDL